MKGSIRERKYGNSDNLRNTRLFKEKSNSSKNGNVMFYGGGYFMDIAI